MALRNPFAKTPAKYHTWDTQRQNQFLKNRRQMRKLVNNYEKAQKNQNAAMMERLRGKHSALRVNERQQRENFNYGVQATKLEERQMGLQQQFISQIGEISATQQRQANQLQQHLVAQMQNQQKQIQQQSQFFEQMRLEQQKLADLEARRAHEEQNRALRDEGMLQHQASQANLFNVMQENRSGARQRAANRRPVSGNRRALFNV